MIQIHALRIVAWFQMLYPLITVRIQIFLMLSSPHLHKRYADSRGHSTGGETWTSLNHLKNVLSCVNRSYHLPFGLQRNTRKRTTITQCLMNARKYTSRRNPSIGKTPLVFLNSSTCIAIAKSIHKMHVTIFQVGKHKRHFSNTCTTNLPSILKAALNSTAYAVHEAHSLCSEVHCPPSS